MSAVDTAAIPEFARAWAGKRLGELEDAQLGPEQVSAIAAWLTWLPLGRPRMVAKLYKLTWPQAVLAANVWADSWAGRAATRAAHGGAPDDCTTVLELENGYRWVLITSPQGLDFEGSAMGHCVGRGSYDGACIYSLRDRHGMPHVTLHHDPAKSHIPHIQGRPNQRTNYLERKYRAMVARLASSLGADIDAAQLAMVDLVKARAPGQRARLYTVEEFCRTRDLTVDANLDLSDYPGLAVLPPGLGVVGNLDISGCTRLESLPRDLSIKGRLKARGCTGLRALPSSWTYLSSLDLRGCTGLVEMGPELEIAGSLHLVGCTGLSWLPQRLRVGKTLDVSGCTQLKGLPQDLDADYVVISGAVSIQSIPLLSSRTKVLWAVGCTGLRELPRGLHLAEFLDLQGCTALQALPDGLVVGGPLKLRDCTNLRTFGERTRVEGWISLIDCPSMGALPPDLLVGGDICRTQEEADISTARALEAESNEKETLGEFDDSEFLALGDFDDEVAEGLPAQQYPCPYAPRLGNPDIEVIEPVFIGNLATSFLDQLVHDRSE